MGYYLPSIMELDLKSVPTDDEDSGYGSDDYDFVKSSLIDPLEFPECISHHTLSELSLRQRPPRCATPIRHITPFSSPDRDDFRAGSGLNNQNKPPLHNHKHKSRVPADLPPLTNPIQSDTDDS